MIQEECIDSIGAQPGDEAVGRRAVRLRLDGGTRARKTGPPEAFAPRPRIDSRVRLLTRRDEKELPPFSHKLMDELMRRCFAQRRKQMHKQLPSTPNSPAWANVAAQLGTATPPRPEELGLQQWATLTTLFDPHPLANIAQKDDEMFDVVNEQNEVIGQATRPEVHAKKLLHRAVHILVFNKNRDCLLQKRSAFKDCHPGLWDSSAAGHVDAGEEPEVAALRELEEELGMTDAKLIPIATLPPSEETGWEHIYLYAAAKTGKITFPAAEISGVIPFPPVLIDQWLKRSPGDFASSFALCWHAARELFTTAP